MLRRAILFSVVISLVPSCATLDTCDEEPCPSRYGSGGAGGKGGSGGMGGVSGTGGIVDVTRSDAGGTSGSPAVHDPTPIPDAAAQPDVPSAPPVQPPPSTMPDAAMDIAATPAPCMSTCMLGKTVCSDGMLRTCAMQVSGCTAWSEPTACTTPQVCSADATKCECAAGCSANEKRCGPNGGVQSCTKMNGCNVWGEEKACGAGETCSKTGSPVCVCAGQCCSDNDCGTCQKCGANQQCVPSSAGKSGRGCTGTCQQCDGAGSCTALNQVTCYRDLDGDSYGDPASPMSACVANGKCPTGYVTDSTDCYDKNADAHPSMVDLQMQPYHDKDRGDGSFDYNCKLGQEKMWPVNYSSCDSGCLPQPNPPLPTPDCGVAFTYITCFKDPIHLVCKPIEQHVVQSCR